MLKLDKLLNPMIHLNIRKHTFEKRVISNKTEAKDIIVSDWESIPLYANLIKSMSLISKNKRQKYITCLHHCISF